MSLLPDALPGGTPRRAGREAQVGQAGCHEPAQFARHGLDGSTVTRSEYDEAGRLVGFAKITRDISERRKAEQALIVLPEPNATVERAARNPGS